jgi:AraC-like DNA-binding protein
MATLDLSHVVGLTGCGHYRQPPGSQPGGPILGAGREKVELLTAGRAWFIIAGQEVEVGPGSLIWHLPGDRMISRSDSAAPYSCLSITWTVSALRRQSPRLSRWKDLSEVIAYTRQLVTAYSDERIDRRTLALSSYAHLHWHAHLHEATVADPVLPQALRNVIAKVEASPELDWSIDDLCRIAGWGASRLHAAFRTHLRISPHQHVLELRLRLARTLLATGDVELEVVARKCGLGSAAALCRRFKRATGVTPGEYRERQR